MCRANKVEGTADPKVKAAKASQLGCNGVSPILQDLEYADYKNIFPLPVAHLLLFGVTKSWLNCLFADTPRGKPIPPHVIPQANRRIIERRMKEIPVPAIIGRSPK